MHEIADTLAALGELHALWCFAGGLMVFVWSGYIGTIDGLPMRWRRIAMLSAAAMLLAVAQRFGRELLEIRGIPNWPWWLGLVVMPVLMMAGGAMRAIAALIWIVCVGVTLELAGNHVADGAAINGAMIVLALLGWLLAVAAQLMEPRSLPAAEEGPQR